MMSPGIEIADVGHVADYFGLEELFFFSLVRPTPHLCEQGEQLPLLVCSRSSRRGRPTPSIYVNPVPEGKGRTTSPQLGWYKVYGTGRPNKPETAWGPDRRGISQETP